ncbi:unnamed protein product [Blepharisma stoltei]|uniref:PAS domain-containing protein n=1 Tax=Blepharisma stoltei TaxID=1481888 RepID=A0AAU9JRW5_9CILI|nr:unnamed protein product [Blepharisma stoltei]
MHNLNKYNSSYEFTPANISVPLSCFYSNISRLYYFLLKMLLWGLLEVLWHDIALASDFKLKNWIFTKSLSLDFTNPAMEKLFQEELRNPIISSDKNLTLWALFSVIFCGFLYSLSGIISAASFLSLLPLFMWNSSNIHLRRFIAEFFSIQFQIAFKESCSIAEIMGGFIPCYMLTAMCFKKWKYSLLYGILEGAMVIYFTNTKVCYVIFAIIAWTGMVTTVEINLRGLWNKYSSSKNQFTELNYVFNTAHSALFLVDRDGNIMSHNQRALWLAQTMGKTEDSLLNTKFYDAFDDDHRPWAKGIVQSIFKGEKRTEEYLITNQISDFKPEDIENLGFIVKADLVGWNNEATMRISFIDISAAVANRIFISNSYKYIQLYLDKFFNETLETYESGHFVWENLIVKISKLQNELRSSLLYQSLLLSRIDIKNEILNIFVELHNVIEILFNLAEKKRITVSLKGSADLPESLYGDKTFHNYILNSLLAFLIDKCELGSELNISSQISNMKDYEFLIQYNFDFVSKAITQEMLDEIFQVKMQGSKRKFFNDFVKIYKKYGCGLFMFDSMICSMRGYTDCRMNSITKEGKISIFLPFTITEKEAVCNVLDLTQKSISHSKYFYEWFPASSNKCKYNKFESESDSSSSESSEQIPDKDSSTEEILKSSKRVKKMRQSKTFSSHIEQLPEFERLAINHQKQQKSSVFSNPGTDINFFGYMNSPA